MTVLRVVSLTHNLYEDVVDLEIERSQARDTSFLVETYYLSVPRSNVLTEDDLKKTVEAEIGKQRKPFPDWTGTSWKVENDAP